jgi:hypothetical protein
LLIKNPPNGGFFIVAQQLKNMIKFLTRIRIKEATMPDRKIYDILKINSGISGISNNMNLHRDLGITSVKLRSICNAIEKAFSIPAGTLKYLVPYFDKIAVSDLIKLTKNEIQNLPYFGDMGLFDILKAQTKKISNFFSRSR